MDLVRQQQAGAGQASSAHAPRTRSKTRASTNVATTAPAAAAAPPTQPAPGTSSAPDPDTSGDSDPGGTVQPLVPLPLPAGAYGPARVPITALSPKERKAEVFRRLEAMREKKRSQASATVSTVQTDDEENAFLALADALGDLLEDTDTFVENRSIWDTVELSLNDYLQPPQGLG